MLLDIVERMLGEILVDLGYDPHFDIGMERLAQIGERTRRRDDKQSLDAALTYDFLKRRGHLMGESMLLEHVPVGLSDAGAAGADRRMRPARAIGALVMGRRVFIGEHLFGFQIEV